MFLNKINVLSCLFILSSVVAWSQENTINQVDSNGKRHGEWIKKYEGSDQIRYEGTFEHGNEVGTFKFYKPKSKDQPTATKTYTKGNDSVHVKFFTQKGSLMSEGNILDKKREGTWKYYHKDSSQLMMVEHYTHDTLDGWQIVYFPNGKITEKKYFENGIVEGENFVYAENGTLIQYYHYKNGKLHGNSKVFNEHGVLLSEGNYKNGQRTGTWKFYKNGKLKETKHY